LGQGGMGKVFLVKRSFDDHYLAVKTLLAGHGAKPEQRRLFLRELRTWIDLPEHPNIVACRFFRTIDSIMLIFNEYVEGGALSDWIRQNQDRSLETILDAAIQAAWGLSAAHDRFVVHQDIKPSNLLISREGVVKVTDFGLARARVVSGWENLEDIHPSALLVSSAGMTVPYCSPQQANGENLNFKTDMWSWAVTILEMFIGKLTWNIGLLAPMVLKAYVNVGPDECGIAMPESVVDLLARCLLNDPDERWASMAEIADRLMEIYKTEFDHGYPRLKPVVTAADPRHTKGFDRHSTAGRSWDNPVDWLKQGRKMIGTRESEDDPFEKGMQLSRKAQAIVDLEYYEEAQMIFESLLKKGFPVNADLAKINSHKGSVHEFIEDLSGAISCYDRAIKLYDIAVQDGMDASFNYDMGLVNMFKGILLTRIHDIENGMNYFDRAIKIAEKNDAEGNRTLMAIACMNKGVSFCYIKEYENSLVFFERAIGNLEQLVDDEKDDKLLNQLMIAYTNKATALRNLDELDEAISLYRKSLDVGRSLINQEERTEYSHMLSVSLINLAIVLIRNGQFHEGFRSYDEAAGILEDMVTHRGIRDVTETLIKCYQSMAMAWVDRKNYPEAEQLYNRCVVLLEEAVTDHGRLHLLGDLAYNCHCNAQVLVRMDRDSYADPLFNRALEILNRMILNSPDAELELQTADTYAWKALALQKCNAVEASKSAAKKAGSILQKHQAQVDTEHYTLYSIAQALNEIRESDSSC